MPTITTAPGPPMPDQAEASRMAVAVVDNEITSYKAIGASAQAPIDPDSAVDVTVFLTVDSVDGDDEVVLPAGCDFSRFNKNPVVMLCHSMGDKGSYYPLPIGKVAWTKLRPRGILGGLVFARTSEMGREVKSLFLEDIQRAVSIGFRSLDSSPMTKEEANSRPDWKAAYERTRGRILVHRKWLLLELSCVPIPSCEDALRVKGLNLPEYRRFLSIPEAPMPEATEPTTEETPDGIEGPAARPEGSEAPPVPGSALAQAVTKAVAGSDSAYGYCPQCGAKAATRERRPNGNDTCEAGHSYPSAKAVHAVKAMAEADSEDEETESEDTPIRQGHFVKCIKGPHKGLTGKVKSVHRGEMVPDVEEDVHGTKADPGVRVNCYKAMGEGHVPTEHHVGCKMSQCEKVDDLKPPKKGKKGLDPATLPPLAGRSDDQIVAASLKTLPEQLRKELQRQEDRALGAV